MTRQEKITYTVIGIIILILLFFAFRKPSIAAVLEDGGQEIGPNYLTYNYSDTILPLVDTSNIYTPSQSNPQGQYPTCGCNGTDNFFASDKELTDYFNKSLEGLADTYINNVVGSLPDWFGQYINNTTGAALSWASQKGLQAF